MTSFLCQCYGYSHTLSVFGLLRSGEGGLSREFGSAENYGPGLYCSGPVDQNYQKFRSM